jgi:hypothetical protein
MGPPHIVRQPMGVLVGRMAPLQDRLKGDLIGRQGLSIAASAAFYHG